MLSTVLFADSFEAGQWAGKWVEDSQNDWFTSTQRSTDGSSAAEVDGRANDATLTLANPIDLTGYYSPKLTFDWLIESEFDAREYLSLDISSDGGTSWQTDVLRLDGNVDAENTWHSETVDLTAYGWTSLKLRFRSTVSGYSEDANVDNVQVLATPVSVDVDSDKPVKVFVLAGQSNLTGTARVDNLDPAWTNQQDDVWIWLDHNMDGGQWTSLGPGHGLSTHKPSPDEPEGFDPINGLGPELSLGSVLADAYPDHRIAFIKHGAGGRDLASHFNPDNIGPPESMEHMWGGMLKKTYDAFAVLDAAGCSYEVEGFYLDLGYGDARNRNSNSSDPGEVLAGEEEAMLRSAAFGENLTRFIEAVRAEFSDDLPFVMSLVRDDLSPEPQQDFPGLELVRQAQLDVAATTPWMVSFPTVGITLRDNVHFDAMGQIEHGTRVADNYLDLIQTTSPPLLSIGDAVSVEGSSFVFSVSLAPPSQEPVAVDFTTDDGSAMAGFDYTPASGTLVFESGITTQTIIVSTIDDTELEPTETFKVLLLNATGAAIADEEGIGEIIDNEVPNAPPVADAGADQTLNDGDGTGAEWVTIAGSATDADGSIVAYQWSEGTTELGTSATLNTTLAVGVHTLTLTATDNEGAVGSDTVVVTVLANQDPTADAGSDVTVTDSDDNGSEAVSLTGSGSDLDGTIVSYQWSEGSTILGSAAGLSTALPVGTHILTLTVTDNGGATASDSVVVTVEQPTTATPLYVYDIRFESRKGGMDWRAVFEIRSDSNGDGQGGTADDTAAGVMISVEFAGITYTGTTDSNGVFRTNWRRLSGSSHYAEVVDLALADYFWDSLSNLNLEDDSDGDGLPDAVLVR